MKLTIDLRCEFDVDAKDPEYAFESLGAFGECVKEAIETLRGSGSCDIVKVQFDGGQGTK